MGSRCLWPRLRRSYLQTPVLKSETGCPRGHSAHPQRERSTAMAQTRPVSSLPARGTRQCLFHRGVCSQAERTFLQKSFHVLGRPFQEHLKAKKTLLSEVVRDANSLGHVGNAAGGLVGAGAPPPAATANIGVCSISMAASPQQPVAVGLPWTGSNSATNLKDSHATPIKSRPGHYFCTSRLRS